MPWRAIYSANVYITVRSILLKPRKKSRRYLAMLQGRQTPLSVYVSACANR